MFAEIRELLKGNLVFIDLEADQHFIKETKKRDHYLLQVGCIKTDNLTIIDEYEENVFSEWPIFYEVAHLLNKDTNYFCNPEFTKESEAYKKFLNFSKGCKIIAFGSYDQIVLDRAAERYGLEKVEVVDLSELLSERCNLSDSSLTKIAKVLDINESNYNKHNALGDAKLLFDIAVKILSINTKEQLNSFINGLQLEHIRPVNLRSKKYKNKSKIDDNLKINENHFYVFEICHSKTFTRDLYTFQQYYSSSSLNFVFSSKGNLVFEKINRYNGSSSEENKKILDDSKKWTEEMIARYRNNIILITTNSIGKVYKNINKKIFNKQYPEIFSISWAAFEKNLFSRIPNADILKKVVVAIESYFYNNKTKRFDKEVNYHIVE